MAYEVVRRKNEVSKCLLCQDAPCNKACPKEIPVADIVRSLRFENEMGAKRKLNNLFCEGCNAPCKDVCIRGKIDHSVDIPMVISDIMEEMPEKPQADLSVEFCGVHCENPFFLSSSVVGSNYEMVAKAFEM